MNNNNKVNQIFHDKYWEYLFVIPFNIISILNFFKLYSVFFGCLVETVDGTKLEQLAR